MNLESLKVFCESLYRETNSREVVFMVAKDMLKRSGYNIEEKTKQKFLDLVLGPQYYNIDYITYRVGFESTSAMMRSKAMTEIIAQIKLERWEHKAGQYTESVINKVNEWLKKNNYPDRIPWISRNGKKHYYKARYLNKDQQDPLNGIHGIRICDKKHEQG